MLRTNHCALLKLPLIFIPSAPVDRKHKRKNNNEGALKMAALMPVRNNYVKYLTIIVHCLHAVKILEILMEKYIFNKKYLNNSLRTDNFIFKVHISNIAWFFLFKLRIL